MKRILKWLAVGVLLLLLLLAGAVLGLQRWTGTDGFKARVEQQAGAALGVAIELGQIDVALWPLPGLALDGIQIKTQPALTLARLEVQPVWAALLQGRLELATLRVREAVLPAQAVDALVVLLQKKKQADKTSPEPGEVSALAFIPRRMAFDGVTWVNVKGVGVTVDAQALLSDDGLPQTASLTVLKGQLEGSKLDLQRDSNSWMLALAVGGGTIKGKVHLQPATQPGGAFELKGQLEAQNVEVAALTRSPEKKGLGGSVLSGQLQASTTLSARSASLAALADVAQTQTSFTVRNAVLHGVDLAQAVKTVGMSRGGETRLDVLAGQVHTRGRALELSNLVATSGVLSATGQVAITPSRALSGRVSVDLVAAPGVGVPLAVGGTLDAPEVSLTRGAMIGAAIGTVLMPGVGTGAGASVGDKVGEGFKKLFGK